AVSVHLLMLAPERPEWHSVPGEFLTWRTRHYHRRPFELRSLQRQNVLQDQLPWIGMCAVDVTLDIKAHHVIALRKKSFSPAAKPTKEINSERLTHSCFD